jgi:NADH:ubiquinone oxidoreductase subunit 3 (subunit A)
MGMDGFVSMALFLAVLTAGLAYVWRRGALEWD